MYSRYFNSSDNTKQSFKNVSSSLLLLPFFYNCGARAGAFTNIYSRDGYILKSPIDRDTDKSPMYYLPPLVGRCAIGRRSSLERSRSKATRPTTRQKSSMLTALRLTQYRAYIFALTP